MSDGPIVRWITSRKNIAGMAGAVIGSSLAFVDIGAWPVVAAALYGVGALLAPSDPAPSDPLMTDQLRFSAKLLDDCMYRERERLPAGVADTIVRLVGVVRMVLDRIDRPGEQLVARTGDPERLAEIEQILGSDLPACVDVYLGRPQSLPAHRAERELVTQLRVIGKAIDRIAASIPDTDADRAEQLTRDLIRRHGLADDES